MENDKDKLTVTQTATTAGTPVQTSASDKDNAELEKEVNEHFPLSGNETDEDLSRALGTDDDE